MLTVVESMDPGQPTNWQEAAHICVSEIFSQVTPALRHLENFSESARRRLVSSYQEKDEYLETVLEALGLLDNQFEGMVQTMNFFVADQMYWVEEWKNLGSLAVAAGVKNGNFFNSAYLPDVDPADWKKAELIKSQSASPDDALDMWVLENAISDVLVRKQTDYGHHNIARFGRNGIIVRCHDKLARLKNLHLTRAGDAKNEALEDTYTDIIGYSAIGMMWERGWFLLDLSKEY